jgi:hypothetical protein
LAKQIQIDELVGIRLQNEAASVAALRNVMGNVNRNDSGQTSQGTKNISEKRENVPSVPGFLVTVNSHGIPYMAPCGTSKPSLDPVNDAAN